MRSILQDIRAALMTPFWIAVCIAVSFTMPDDKERA